MIKTILMLVGLALVSFIFGVGYANVSREKIADIYVSKGSGRDGADRVTMLFKDNFDPMCDKLGNHKCRVSVHVGWYPDVGEDLEEAEVKEL